MRQLCRSLIAVAALVLAFGAAPAKADQLTYSFSTFGTTATFMLPSNPTPSLIGSNYFQINDVTISISGIGNETANLDFFTTAAGGGLGSGVNRLDGLQLFSGTLSNPTLLAGSFPLSGTVSPDGDGSVPVSGTLLASALGAVPEPSSIVLFLTATGAAALMFRKRLLVGQFVR